ncbi:hypothetical protein PEP31012_01642 [Pandoraea eparura]|jgi:hypothetical protein|uniref:Uncharacterized protein n=1 Tax=Pandoraea eparura TaxID=2508291 RepID=A0A5E4TV74_9BURK|nr:hypothetical protein PEP31012_01642 [Pandoraea eparura]
MVHLPLSDSRVALSRWILCNLRSAGQRRGETSGLADGPRVKATIMHHKNR